MNKIILLIPVFMFLVGCKNTIDEIEHSENKIQQELKYNLGEDIKLQDNTFISHFKSIFLVTSDLDGDGIRENICLRVDPKYFKPINIDENADSILDSVPAILVINDQFLRLVLNFNCLAYSYGGCEIKIIDIDPTDNLREVDLSITDLGLIESPIVHHILRFVENKISNTKLEKKLSQNNLYDVTLQNENDEKQLLIVYSVRESIDSIYDVKVKLCLYNFGLGIVGQNTSSLYYKPFAQ